METDAPLPGNYCLKARVTGIINFGICLTLRDGDREYYYKKLDAHFPGLKQKYQQKYGNRYVLESDQNDCLMGIFHEICQDHGIIHEPDAVFQYLHAYENQPGRRR